jgi:uncharacterized protein YbaA (DUF1428 family)
VGKTTSFTRAVNLKEGETVIFSYVVYKNRKHRDQVMKKVMEDPRMAPSDMPAYMKRMIYGGFNTVIEM